MSTSGGKSGVIISKPGLDERFNARSAGFMQALLAWRVPDSVAGPRCQRLQVIADEPARPVSPLRCQSASGSVYITHAPAALLSLPQAQVLAKVRWQIELLFMRWQSHGWLHEWPTNHPWPVLTECFAKLLA